MTTHPMSIHPMSIHPPSTHPSTCAVTAFGTAALVSVTDTTQARAVAEALRARLNGIGAVVPGADTVLVHPGTTSESLVTAVAAALAAESVPTPSRTVETVRIPVTYDGEDLPVVADLLGVSVEEIIARHTAATYTVDFLGFAPGFPYLSGLDPFLSSVPRLDMPRSRVPAGSVGLAAGRTCIYPTASPGGWHLLGFTDAVLFNPTNEASPALLDAGTQVVFEAVR